MISLYIIINITDFLAAINKWSHYTKKNPYWGGDSVINSIFNSLLLLISLHTPNTVGRGGLRDIDIIMFLISFLYLSSPSRLDKLPRLFLIGITYLTKRLEGRQVKSHWYQYVWMFKYVLSMLFYVNLKPYDHFFMK